MRTYSGYTVDEILNEPYTITGEQDAINIMHELIAENEKLRKEVKRWQDAHKEDLELRENDHYN